MPIPIESPVSIAPLLVGVDDATRVLGIKRSSLFLLFQSGALKSTKIGARRLVKVSDLEDYVATLAAEV